MTHALMWNRALNTTEVMTLERAASLGRRAYRNDAPAQWALIMTGSLFDMRVTQHSIAPTLAFRACKQKAAA
jgi:hypothetical protein